MHSGKKISCLVVDDEPMAQDVLTAHISQVPFLQLVQVCSNALEAFEALHKQHVDLVFLDINMPVISGLNFLRSLKEPPAVVITTAYPEYAVEGFELDAVDYMLKPVSFARFSKAVAKAAQVLSHPGHGTMQAQEPKSAEIMQPATADVPEKTYFFVKADGKLVKLQYADILYIEAMKDYLKIHIASGSPVVTHQTMKAMEELLPAKKFMRIHKSFIISLDAIRAIDGNIVHIAKTELPVGYTYRESLLSAVAPGGK